MTTNDDDRLNLKSSGNYNNYMMLEEPFSIYPCNLTLKTQE